MGMENERLLHAERLDRAGHSGVGSACNRHVRETWSAVELPSIYLSKKDAGWNTWPHYISEQRGEVHVQGATRTPFLIRAAFNSPHLAPT